MNEKISKTSEGKRIIDATIKLLKKDANLHDYAKIYLSGIPPKSLEKHDTKNLATFIEKRYNFLNKSLKKLGQTEVKQTERAKEQDLFTLEMVYPDAQFMIVTLEALFNENDIHITQLHHPIFTVETNKDHSIKSVKKPKQNTKLISQIYIEISAKTGHMSLKELTAAIKEKMDAVQSSRVDMEEMLAEVNSIKEQVAEIPNLAKAQDEWIDLFDWLKNYNFSFYGYCAFEINKKSVKLKNGSTKGILNSKLCKLSSPILKTLKSHTEKLTDYRSPFIFDTIPFKSPIQRFENLMRLSLKIPTGNNTYIEHNFLGLLKQSSLLVKNLETPIIRTKMNAIFDHKHLLPGSYDFNQTIRIFTATPKFELFRTPTENLLELTENILSITNPNDIYCFTRTQIEYSRIFLLVCIPTSLFTEENIDQIINYLQNETPYDSLEVIQARNESICRLHIYFDNPTCEECRIDPELVETELRQLIKPWDEKLRNTILDKYPGEKGHGLYHDFIDDFPSHHKVRRTPEETLRDIEHLEKMEEEKSVQFNLVNFNFPDSALSNKSSILFIYNDTKIDLITVMPILQNLGLHVYDELTTRIGTLERTRGYIHSFRVTDRNLNKIDEGSYQTILVDLLKEIFKGRAINDPLNELLFSAKLDWRTISIFQAYRGYYLQLNTRYSREKINNTLLTYTDSVKIIAEYFVQRFSTDKNLKDAAHRSEKTLPKIKQKFLDSLSDVSDIASDVILKRFFNFIESTLRTNFYIPKKDGDVFISLKIDSQSVKLPLPVPYREIFVFDPEMEGCHLRFGAVARGGLRWSDRIDDFRREVLGLVKAQVTKNVVIVPVGSKGGFIIKKELKSREEAAEQSQVQYKKFIRGLLDITDNLDASGRTVHPKNVIRYDNPDPYLVVAADKGTAQFSDLANEISDSYNFWLGDGFASGGSYGYNHKVVGITAKGAWECVKLHFKELGMDCQKDPFTVAGIGDMSGDVFGNGMLLSKAIKLQAAFNHMHIFLDPDPDPAKSFKERDRLFKLERSSWTDYDKKLISKGGGIFERKAKEIKLTPEIQEMLGTDRDVMTGEELITAVLKMKVDLIWFGGIGTYIKNEGETHFQVGDPANDSVRIDHNEVNARVIGEGANLGTTMAARIGLDMNGVKINTDFIDNSAGVNMSDYEVNMKILLKRLMQEGKVKSMDDRNNILEKATDEVTDLVLKNNRGQHRLISMDSIRSTRKANVFHKLMQHYISTKLLNPAEEVLPDHNQLEDMADNGAPIPRPALATLQSYTKMYVYDALEKSDLLGNPDLEPFYTNYLPPLVRKKFKNDIQIHHLKKEIIGTVLTNKIVNLAGITFFYQVEQITSRSVADIALAYLIVDESLDIETLRRTILDSATSTETQYEAVIEIGNMVQDLVIDLLQLPNVDLSFKLVNTIQEMSESLIKELLKTPEIKKDVSIWVKKGFPDKIAKQIATLKHMGLLSDLITFNNQQKLNASSSLQLTLKLDETFGFEWVKHKLNEIPLKTQWEFTQKDQLSQRIRSQKIKLAQVLLTNTKKIEKISPNDILEIVKTEYPETIDTYFKTLQLLRSSSTVDLTSLTVTINRLNSLT